MSELELLGYVVPAVHAQVESQRTGVAAQGALGAAYDLARGEVGSSDTGRFG